MFLNGHIPCAPYRPLMMWCLSPTSTYIHHQKGFIHTNKLTTADITLLPSFGAPALVYSQHNRPARRFKTHKYSYIYESSPGSFFIYKACIFSSFIDFTLKTVKVQLQAQTQWNLTKVPHDSNMTASNKTALQLINQLNTEASSRFGANLNKKISKVLLFWVSEELHFFTPPCCTQTGSAVLAPVRFYRLILAIQNIHTSSDRRKSPAPPDRERDTAWFLQHNYQLPAGSRHTATDTVYLGRSLTH